ncbi:hypothetical protein K5D56_26760, partial [Pseudomonas cichorii]|nr:hypothetical protein [Pseudomonas cichorii]
HGNPDDKGDGVHVFLGGHHRPYGWDRVGEFAGRLLCRFGDGAILRRQLGKSRVSANTSRFA